MEVGKILASQQQQQQQQTTINVTGSEKRGSEKRGHFAQATKILF